MLADHDDTDGGGQGQGGGPPGDERVIPLARPWTPPVELNSVDDFSNPLLLRGISAGRAALHVVIVVGMFAIAMLVYGLWHGPVAPEAGGAEPPVDMTEVIVATVIIGLVLSVTAGGLMAASGVPLRCLGVSGRSLGVNILLGVPVAMASYAIYLICFGVMSVVWPEGSKELSENAGRVKAMIPDVSTPVLLLLMLGVAMYEEFIFRGFLVTHLRRITGSWIAAIVLAGGVFAWLHIGTEQGTQTPAVFVPLLGVAALWAVMLGWRRSLVPGIVGHALFNSVQLVALRYLASKGEI